MTRCLSHALVKYQKDLDSGIKELTKEWDESDSDLAHRLTEPDRVTSEDLSRQYSPEDVRQLCLRTKVCVDMTLFNCLWDAKKRFDKKERLKNRSEVFINKMYIKAVKKKMVIPYEPKEIEKSVHIRRCILKKRNNIRLDRWNNLPTQESSTSLSIEEISEDQEPSSMLAQIPNESPNSSRVASDNTINYSVADISSGPISSEPQLRHVGNTESEILQLPAIAENEDVNMSKNTGAEHAQLAANDQSKDAQTSKEKSLEESGIDFEAAAMAIDPESMIIDLAASDQSKDAQTSMEKSLEESGIDWEAAAMAIDPESMIIDSDAQTPQTESEPLVEDYSIFSSQVLCTSTESTEITDDLI
ncbi:telomere-binding protein cav-like [Drosophila nasuta]|uniref:telomere-binding protein cav-like n=1 Tax=Drosophila nasuta TaxID=42062 RepID=UPI00295EEAAF|nr:telomere-binding protein cav-like [Drosophila nasuta]